MMSDVEIARSADLKPIEEVASAAGLKEGEFVRWGDFKAKVSLKVWDRVRLRSDGKLVLVTTINPTPDGEGKTTVTIGLAQALARLGKRVMLGIREPSLGPMMGRKGGATGGGFSQVVPMEDINLHFTGDMHAVTSAHNLLASLVDNHVHHGNVFHIDPRYITWPRVLDISDRSLRHVVVGLGGPLNGVPHEVEFSITPASEVMAVVCLSQSLVDLKERLGRIIVAYTYGDEPITAGRLNAVGAMSVLLRDVLKPNLVQTLEGVPAFVHGGPFANIAHGASSLISTMMGVKLADYFVTEAGFGSELGAEKFFDIVCRVGGLKPDAVVLVVSVRALKRHGGGEGKDAVERGLCNLEKHMENIELFGVPFVVALNRFQSDRDDEIEVVERFCEKKGVPFAVADVWRYGGEGGVELAGKLVDLIHNRGSRFSPLYDLSLSVKDKIEVVAREMYGAGRVVYTVTAEQDIRLCERLGLDGLPVCIAKTQYSLSDDSLLLGRPEGFKVTIREIKFSAGAGFLVPMTGKITTMPGLPRKPHAEKMDLDEYGNIYF